MYAGTYEAYAANTAVKSAHRVVADTENTVIDTENAVTDTENAVTAVIAVIAVTGPDHLIQQHIEILDRSGHRRGRGHREFVKYTEYTE